MGPRNAAHPAAQPAATPSAPARMITARAQDGRAAKQREPQQQQERRRPAAPASPTATRPSGTARTARRPNNASTRCARSGAGAPLPPAAKQHGPAPGGHNGGHRPARGPQLILRARSSARGRARRRGALHGPAHTALSPTAARRTRRSATAAHHRHQRSPCKADRGALEAPATAVTRAHHAASPARRRRTPRRTAETPGCQPPAPHARPGHHNTHRRHIPIRKTAPCAEPSSGLIPAGSRGAISMVNSQRFGETVGHGEAKVDEDESAVPAAAEGGDSAPSTYPMIPPSQGVTDKRC